MTFWMPMTDEGKAEWARVKENQKRWQACQDRMTAGPSAIVCPSCSVRGGGHDTYCGVAIRRAAVDALSWRERIRSIPGLPDPGDAETMLAREAVTFAEIFEDAYCPEAIRLRLVLDEVQRIKQ